ncbi:DUF5665 domain-containing protein [Marinicrinis sediminis]|uniref:DUF5665 domain-containing protein n=1 Tax=Marinicrinis sediminis TaxID=1652465 RepID=A0ABW5RBV6_9BACL
MKQQVSIQGIEERLERLAKKLESGEIAEYVRLANSPGKLLIRNLFAGIARGVGYAIGISVFLLLMLYILRALGALNLPIIGDFIADIVKIVQIQLKLDGYAELSHTVSAMIHIGHINRI